ncbi:MAG: hypothetical protein JXA52_06280 [Planctomycetes bacterium]|nr:hypothetical protein [Planctomycetota bacterium]
MPAVLSWRLRATPGTAAYILICLWGLLFIFAITGTNPERMLLRCFDASLAMLIFLTATLFGRNILNILTYKALHPLSGMIFSTLLGLGALSLLVLLLGTAGLLAFWPMIILLVIMLMCGFVNLKAVGSDLKAVARSLTSFDSTDLILLTTILFALWLSLPAVFLPPVDYDVTEYHAQLPREYVEMGRIAFRPQNAFSGMPQNLEMLTTLAFALRGIRGWALAKLLHWLLLPLLLLEVMMLAKSCFNNVKAGRKAALAAGLILFLSPLTTTMAGMLYVEIGMCAYGCAAAMLVLPVIKVNQNICTWRWVFAAGIFAGLAAGAKYPGLLFFAAPLALLLLFSQLFKNPELAGESPPQGRKAILSLVFIILGVLVSFGPWLVKNYIQTGNPVYPIWNQAFGVEDWNETLEQRFVVAHRASDCSPAAAKTAASAILSGHSLMPLGLLFLGLCLLPRALKIKSSEATEAESRKHSEDQDLLSLWLILVWTVIIVLLWFFFTHRLERFLFPAHVLAAVLGGWGWLRLYRLTGRVVALISLQAFFLLVTTAIFITSYFFPLAGNEKAPTGMALAWGSAPPEAMLQYIRSWRTGRVLQQHAIPGKALLLGEITGYWLPNSAEGAVVFSQHQLEETLAESNTPEDLAGNLQSRGYTHLVISWPELARLHATYYQAWQFTDAEQKLLRLFLEQYTAGVIPVDAWRQWQAGNWQLLPFALQDSEQYSQYFGKAFRAGNPSPAYQRARPWLAVVATAKGETPDQDFLRLDELWRDYAILLAPDSGGGPPPVGYYPNEIILLKQPN